MEIFINLCMSDITVMWIYVAIIQNGIIHDILLNIIRTGKMSVAKHTWTLVCRFSAVWGGAEEMRTSEFDSSSEDEVGEEELTPLHISW